MTTGRQHYTPPPQRRRDVRVAFRLLGIPGAVIAVLLMLAGLHAHQQSTAADELVDARREAFQAGQQDAIDSGCRRALSPPIGAAP